MKVFSPLAPKIWAFFELSGAIFLPAMVVNTSTCGSASFHECLMIAEYVCISVSLYCVYRTFIFMFHDCVHVYLYVCWSVCVCVFVCGSGGKICRFTHTFLCGHATCLCDP